MSRQKALRCLQGVALDVFHVLFEKGSSPWVCDDWRQWDFSGSSSSWEGQLAQESAQPRLREPAHRRQQVLLAASATMTPPPGLVASQRSLVGEHCVVETVSPTSVKVSFTSKVVRDAVLGRGKKVRVSIAGIDVLLRPFWCKETYSYTETKIFLTPWGEDRGQRKKRQLPLVGSVARWADERVKALHTLQCEDLPTEQDTLQEALVEIASELQELVAMAKTLSGDATAEPAEDDEEGLPITAVIRSRIASLRSALTQKARVEPVNGERPVQRRWHRVM